VSKQVIVIAPYVHLNGTSKESLLEDLEVAYAAIQAAQEALGKSAPNGRDYYLEPGLFPSAVAQHQYRQRRLQDLLDEIQVEVNLILDGKAGRQVVNL